MSEVAYFSEVSDGDRGTSSRGGEETNQPDTGPELENATLSGIKGKERKKETPTLKKRISGYILLLTQMCFVMVFFFFFFYPRTKLSESCEGDLLEGFGEVGCSSFGRKEVA